MDIYKGITQLNTLISSYNKSVKFFKKDFDCKILFGDYLFELNDILTKVSPYGNVCFISKKSTFEKFGKEIYQSLKAKGITLTSYILKDNAKTDVNTISWLVNLPETVRAVIVSDTEFIHIAAYFSEVKNIPLIILPSTLNMQFVLDRDVFINTFGSIDKIRVNSKRFVIIDDCFIGDNGKDIALSHILSKTVALIDYRIYTEVLGEKLNPTSYSLVKETLVDLLKFDLSRDDFEDAIIYSGLKLQVAYLFSSGKINYLSSERVGQIIINKGENVVDLEEYSLAKKILPLYELFFIKGLSDFAPFINYRDRAEEISNAINLDKLFCLSGLKNQINLLNSFYKRYQDFLDKFKSEIERVILLSKGIKEKFDCIFKTETQIDYKKIIYQIPDYPLGVRGVSVLRDFGVLEKFYD